MAALFCKEACRTESVSANKLLKAMDVAFVCLASQRPNLFNVANALAAATPETKKEAATIFPLFQNLTSSLHSNLNVCILRFPQLWICCCKIVDLFRVSKVKLPRLHGPPLVCEGIVGHV